jgi:hypothetical protein
MANGIPPICKAMVLCDGLYQSPSTHRFSLLETLGRNLQAVTFPQPWSPIGVYLVSTSGHGLTGLTLRWINEAGEQLPDTEQYMEVDFGDPLDVEEVAFFCEGLTFPAPGEYRVELCVADELVMGRSLLVLPVIERDDSGGFQ